MRHLVLGHHGMRSRSLFPVATVIPGPVLVVVVVIISGGGVVVMIVPRVAVGIITVTAVIRIMVAVPMIVTVGVAGVVIVRRIINRPIPSHIPRPTVAVSRIISRRIRRAAV